MKLTKCRLQTALAQTDIASGMRPGVPSHRGIKLFAAPAAVAAVIATSAGLSATHVPRAATESRSAAVASVPPYYMARVGRVGNASGFAREGVIRHTLSGKPVAIVRLPKPYSYIRAVAGSANDREFLLAARSTTSTKGSTVFYLARFNPANRKVTVARLHIPPVIAPADQVAGLAVSTTGTQVAIAVNPQPVAPGPAQISVYSLTTGKVTVWKANKAYIGSFFDDPTSLSWASDGKLAFNAFTDNKLNYSVWLLNTATAGGNLLADSHFVVKMEGHGPWNPNGDGLVTPSGTRVVTTLWRGYPNRSSSHLLGEFAEFSTVTGKPIGVLYRKLGAIGTLDWTNPTGSVLVAGIQLQGHGFGELGVVVGDEFTPLRGAPAVEGSTATIAF